MFRNLLERYAPKIVGKDGFALGFMTTFMCVVPISAALIFSSADQALGDKVVLLAYALSAAFTGLLLEGRRLAARLSAVQPAPLAYRLATWLPFFLALALALYGVEPQSAQERVYVRPFAGRLEDLWTASPASEPARFVGLRGRTLALTRSSQQHPPQVSLVMPPSLRARSWEEVAYLVLIDTSSSQRDQAGRQGVDRFQVQVLEYPGRRMVLVNSWEAPYRLVRGPKGFSKHYLQGDSDGLAEWADALAAHAVTAGARTAAN